nr:hypothetical protein PsAHV6-036 [Psittacid alphaherpesvirus 6]
MRRRRRIRRSCGFLVGAYNSACMVPRTTTRLPKYPSLRLGSPVPPPLRDFIARSFPFTDSTH